MFTINTPSHNIKFTFQHKHYEPTQIRDKVWVDADTLCILEVDGTTHYEWAYCSVKDNFNKERGRKTSLAKALKISGLDKDTKTAIWERYFYRDISNEDYNG